MKYWYEYPDLRSREKLLDMLTRGMTQQQIAQTLGCTRRSVRSALTAHNIRCPVVVLPDTLKKKLRL